MKTKFFRSLFALLVVSALTSLAQAAGIGASLLTQQHPFYIELADAMREQAKTHNVPLQISIANQDLNRQIADVEDFIVKGMDVIIISPVDSQGVIAALARAQAAGIKVITVDIAAAQGQVVSHIGTDNYTGGVKAGELMAQILHGQGKVAIIDYPTVQSVVNRVNGFKDALKNHPGIKIVAQQTGITRAAALAAAQNMLQAEPEITGIFGFGDDAALAAAVAVKSAGLEHQVKVIGFDGMQEAREAVDNNPVMVGVIQQFPQQMGQQAIDTAVKVMAGETVLAEQPIVPGVYTKTNTP